MILSKKYTRHRYSGVINLVNNIKSILLFLAIILSCSLMAADNNPTTIKIALLPDEDAATLIKKHQRFKAYLTEHLGREIELLVTTDYSSMIEAMRHARIDLGYFGPLSYVIARSRSNIEAFAAKTNHGSSTYQAVVVGSVRRGVMSLDEIKGGDMAYGDLASTSSHLIPKKMLLDAKLQAGKDYQAHFLGAHDAVAMAVQRGHASAGGLSKPIFEMLLERGVIDVNKVRVLAVSTPFPQYPWAMRSDLNPVLKARIKRAFYQLQDKNILKTMKAEGLVPVSDIDYDIVRELKSALDL
ncbi:MAG: phosphate/phosphite/phosphonate ABC transporter substrate-binding protein [Gammaproteobacteria bacterium]|nr:phosphate/phosphite/phosphonate ABC transporter substrate-binding protein [Gammaproteobacteria bacterium]